MPGFEESGAEPGFRDLDWLRDPSGDARLAARYFRAAGYPSCRYGGEHTLFIVGVSSSPDAEVAQRVEAAARRLGFKTRLRLYPFDTVDRQVLWWPRLRGPRVHERGWAKDFWTPRRCSITRSTGIPTGRVDDRERVRARRSRLNAMIARARLVTRPQSGRRHGREVNHAALRLAPTVPFLWE